MTIHRFALALMIALLALLGGIAEAKSRGNGRFIDMPKVLSTHVDAQHVTIWLPPGYERGRKRYGVVYMQDGQNIFPAVPPRLGETWDANASIVRLVAAKQIEPVIIVAIWNPGGARGRQYLPQSVYAAAPGWAKADADRMIKGPVFSDAYLRFLTGELKPMIDRRYRTLADRDHSSIVGSSLGGLLALYAIAEYPQIFGAAACLSTHWPMSNPVITVPQRDELLAVWERYLTDRLGPPAGRRIWFDHGDKSLDSGYGPWQSAIDAQLVRIGWQPGSDMTTRLYQGGAHDEASWSARLDDVFGWVLRPRE